MCSLKIVIKNNFEFDFRKYKSIGTARTNLAENKPGLEHLQGLYPKIIIKDVTWISSCPLWRIKMDALSDRVCF